MMNDIKSLWPARYYASYDTTAPSPCPVTGWYDVWGMSSTDHVPPDTNMIALTEEEWDTRQSLGFGVKDGKIVPYTPPITLAGQQGVLASLTAQKKSLGVYYKPAGASVAVLFPSDDTAYTSALQEAQTVQLGAWTDGTQWTLADGSSVPMTGADVTALFKRLAAYRAACQNHAAALNEALTHDLNTDLTTGWPDNHQGGAS